MNERMSEIKTWRYSWPNEKYGGWGVVFVDSVGCVAAITDWGNFSYRWNPNGFSASSPDFRHEILRMDADYMVRKFMGARLYEYDGEATVKHVLERLAELELTQDQVEEEKELLERSGNLYYEDEFNAWCGNTNVPDPHELRQERYCREAVSFEKHVFPKLQAAIRAELERERAAVVALPVPSAHG